MTGAWYPHWLTRLICTLAGHKPARFHAIAWCTRCDRELP